MCIMLFLPITGKYVLDFHEGIGFGGSHHLENPGLQVTGTSMNLLP
jgi:hypothetical protein